MGLLQAFELVSDNGTMEPLPKELNAHEELVNTAYRNGLIIYSRRSRGGYSGDHFLVAPPMITTEEQVDEIIEKLTLSLDQFISDKGLG
jgi:adenosylmethionine-8-amino-7-oxononanoate aminotransferase